MCWSQQSPSELSARDLYYREQSDDGQPKSAKSQSTKEAGQVRRGKDANAVTHKGSGAGKLGAPTDAVTSSESGGVQLAAQKVAVTTGQHLGLRYNVVLIDPASGKAEPADSDRIFQPGECVALQFEANRPGYLYVLEQGSSGAWNPLLPSALMPDEANVLKARTTLRVPEKHCFEIEGPPGEERVFVVLSPNPEDFYDLHQSIKNNSGAADAPGLLTQDFLAQEVKRLEANLRDRDLKVKKITQPESAGEPPNSVYVVNASSSSTDRVVTEIRIQHR